MLCSGVLLQQHGNDMSPTACVIAKMIKGIPDLPDIAAYDYHVLGLIKKTVGEIRFDLMKCKRQLKNGLTSANPLAPNSAYAVSHHTGFIS